MKCTDLAEMAMTLMDSSGNHIAILVAALTVNNTGDNC